MKALIVLIAVISISINACALDDKARKQLIRIYDMTNELYSNSQGLLDDFQNNEVDADFAGRRTREWRERYNRETEPVPGEGARLHAMTNELLDISYEIIRENFPQSQHTKDLLKRLDDHVEELRREANHVRYLLK